MPTVHEEGAITLSSVHLDAVRGLAALTVMTFHLRGFFFTSLTDATQASREEESVTTAHTSTPAAHPPKRADMGNTPVMMFFVLSGYLVGGSVLRSLKKGRWSTRGYLAKRMTRLWVVLIPALLLGVLLDHVGPRLFGGPGQIYVAHVAYVFPYVEQNLGSLLVIANALFLQGIFVLTPGTNSALWSLANEFWYYMLFPMVMVPILLHRSLRLRLGSLALVLGFLAFVWSRSDPHSAKHIPLLFPIWLLGALLSQLPPVVRVSRRNFLTCLMICATLGGTMLLRKFDLGVRASQYIIAVLFTGLLYMLLHYPEKAKSGPYKSIAGFFSRISYSLYLIHMPVGAFLAAWLLRPWHLRAKTPENFALYLLFCGLVILVTYAFYLAFEANTEYVRRFVLREEVPPKIASLNVR